MTDIAVVPLHEEIVGRVQPVLLMLLASVGLLLVVASASLANLLLVRAVSRQRELAIRAALGAAGSALMIPLAAETIVLAGAGCLLGLGLAYGAVQFVTTTTLFSLPRAAEVSLSWPVLGFALAVTSATALSLGVLVAWRGRRPGIVEWLKDAQRGNTGGAPLRRLRNVVVVTQLAVSVVLLVGAGLLGRSLSAVASSESRLPDRRRAGGANLESAAVDSLYANWHRAGRSREPPATSRVQRARDRAAGGPPWRHRRRRHQWISVGRRRFGRPVPHHPRR